MCTCLHAYMLSSLSFLVCLGWHLFKDILITLAAGGRAGCVGWADGVRYARTDFFDTPSVGEGFHIQLQEAR